MGQEHLIKTITHSWQVGAKIMKQSKQVLKKYKKEGRARLFFGFNMQNQDTGLPALVVALCSNRSKCSDRNRMPCKRSWIAFPVVWMLFLPFRPQPLNREQLHFVLCIKQTMMVNSNVPRYSNLASELHRNYFFKFKLVLSSFRSNTHMMAPPVVRTDYKLVLFQLQQLIWWNCTASIRFERWLQQCFGKNQTCTIFQSQ